EKSQVKEIKSLNEDILQVKHTIEDMNEKIIVMLGELHNCVTEDEFTVLKKYIEIWQPTSFVTKDELMDLLRIRKQEKNL
ncbi:MAG: hypothetical protein V1743_06560, partial [Nanoarchaeota archaeon]